MINAKRARAAVPGSFCVSGRECWRGFLSGSIYCHRKEVMSEVSDISK